MSRRLFASIVVVAMASLLIMPGVAAAAAGTSPSDAYAPDGAWRQINRGQSQWYSFRYDGKDEQILVKMDAKPSDGAMFMVMTPEQVRQWEKTGEEKSCGCSSEDMYVSADRSWSGSFNIPGTYYIMVKHSGNHATPTDYSLTVSGKGVSVPEAARSVAPAGVMAPAPAPAAKAVEEMSPFEDWMAMPGGTSHWETFHYDEINSQVELVMDAEPNNAVSFSVWTPEQVRRYSLGEDVQPVGRGTKNEDAPGDVSWSGSFTSPGTYYVRVEHLGQGTSYCKLALKGDNAWF
jgi:hypothetical protein